VGTLAVGLLGYIWYSDEGTGRGRSLPRSFLAVSNVTVHWPTVCVPITVLLTFWREILGMTHYKYSYTAVQKLWLLTASIFHSRRTANPVLHQLRWQLQQCSCTEWSWFRNYRA